MIICLLNMVCSMLVMGLNMDVIFLSNVGCCYLDCIDSVVVGIC